MLNDRTKFILKPYIERTTLFSLIGTIFEIIQIQEFGKFDEVPSYYLVAVHIACEPIKMNAQSFGRFHNQFFLLYNNLLHINFECAHISSL